MTEIYVSTDVETDGPVPGLFSMLSIGSAAFAADGTALGTFSANLEPLADARQDPGTMKFWASQPKAWAAHRVGLEDAEAAMCRYSAWLKDLPGEPVFVGYPAGFDFTFVYWYLHWATGECPFGFQALDIKTYAMAVLKKGFKETSKSTMPKRWFQDEHHSHVAVEDAVEQGLLFIAMLKENCAVDVRRVSPTCRELDHHLWGCWHAVGIDPALPLTRNCLRDGCAVAEDKPRGRGV